MIRFLLLLAAIACELAAALSLFGRLVHLEQTHAVGAIALGLALYFVAIASPPAPAAG